MRPGARHDTGKSHMAEGDDAIRRWCRDGDERWFERFYHAHATPLWRMLVLRGVDRDAAYDVVAEAFSRLIQQVCQRPEAPRALLYRIALNLVTDRFRRSRVRAVSDTDPDTLGHAGPPVELTEEARRLLTLLDPSEQNLLLMRYWLGMTHREVAEVLECPEGTVRRRAAALLQRLQETFDET
ncbi:RNA polymerase sigma factor [Halofilum ochraceum]|uniref:RNA polymerase sigma factor n=1 Tax=Halofilum ochraceum TaxID=1611323 RepID=UPI0015864A3C|nr:RNA polymerase sigma factor [Halofilum ochraceum]